MRTNVEQGKGETYEMQSTSEVAILLFEIQGLIAAETKC